MTHVLLTGSRGFLGSRIAAELIERGVSTTCWHHDVPLADAPWSQVTHVVNCAAVVPKAGVDAGAYWAGNVQWIESLLPHLDDRHVVHFGTVSAFYRVSAYQVSKLLGEALLRESASRFASLEVVPVPTLDDEGLVTMLAGKADAGDEPTITRLRYTWCAPEEVARHVAEDLVGGAGGPLRVEERLLTERVRERTEGVFHEGPEQDRRCSADGIRVTNDEARASFLALFAD